MYTTIIFDFFNVLYADSYKVWLAKHGFTRTGDFKEASERLDLGHIDFDTFIGLISAAGKQKIEDVQAEFVQQDKLDTALVKFIAALQPQYKLGLLSNANALRLRTLLKRYDLEKLFDEIIISGEVGIVKPDPEIFHLMLNRLNATPENSIFIDDFEFNVEAAQSLGITGVWYKDLPTLKHDLKNLHISW